MIYMGICSLDQLLAIHYVAGTYSSFTNTIATSHYPNTTGNKWFKLVNSIGICDLNINFPLVCCCSIF